MEPERHIMLDLETMGTGPDAAIVAIGATKFIPYDQSDYEKFYIVVDLESAMRYGGKVEGGTVMWWLKQSDTARAALSAGPLDIVSALEGFRQWYGEDPRVPIWGNGATFDNVIMASAYKRIAAKPPWSHQSDRCYRTLKNLYPSVPTPPPVGTSHNALDDAVWQTEHLRLIVREHTRR